MSFCSNTMKDEFNKKIIKSKHDKNTDMFIIFC